MDMSSIDPVVARELCALVEARGCGMLDAPVSGGQEKAEKGTLSIMVGGREDVYERVRDILDLMGKSLCVGPSGAGQVTKLVNQTIVAANIAAVAEEQAASSREIATGIDAATKSTVDMLQNMEMIQSSSDETARVAEDVAKQADGLAVLADRLKKALSRFKVSSDDASGARRVALKG